MGGSNDQPMPQDFGAEVIGVALQFARNKTGLEIIKVAVVLRLRMFGICKGGSCAYLGSTRGAGLFVQWVLGGYP
jgi:hypothetical protein